MLNYSFVIKTKLKKSILPIKQFDQIVKIINKQQNLSKQKLFFDLSIVDLKTIKDVNKKYRKINKPTDVITFAFKDAKKSITHGLLGEIFICYDIAIKQAKQNKWSTNKELCLLFVHGILHLLQYDHQTNKKYKQMVNVQNNILKQIKF